MNNTIPPITNELGKHWKQPALDRILLDDTHALLDARTLAELPEYSTTFPSGVYEGKMWKRNEAMFIKGGKLLLCWFEAASEDTCRINSRTILIA